MSLLHGTESILCDLACCALYLEFKERHLCDDMLHLLIGIDMQMHFIFADSLLFFELVIRKLVQFDTAGLLGGRDLAEEETWGDTAEEREKAECERGAQRGVGTGRASGCARNRAVPKRGPKAPSPAPLRLLLCSLCTAFVRGKSARPSKVPCSLIHLRCVPPTDPLS